MISLAYKISHCLSANRNPELRFVICTGVTLFALLLHLNCTSTALSQSKSSNFFMCIIIVKTQQSAVFRTSQKQIEICSFVFVTVSVYLVCIKWSLAF